MRRIFFEYALAIKCTIIHDVPQLYRASIRQSYFLAPAILSDADVTRKSTFSSTISRDTASNFCLTDFNFNE